jgi:CHAT domain-containing protein/tetratricopeptide (TPR) repeat protein
MSRHSQLVIVCSAVVLMGTVGCNKVSSERERLAPLVAALGGRRPLELRLTGGFTYAPCQSSPSTLGLECTRCRLERPRPRVVAQAISTITTQAGTAPVRLHAEAIADLAIDPDQGATRAIQKLEVATREKGDAQILSDLAAAYTERACRDHAPYDLVRGLNTVERAVTADPGLPEALFNRALILERLHLKSQAKEAWKRYQALDRDSGWSREAARHNGNLSRAAQYAGSDVDERSALVAAASHGDKNAVLRLVAASPQVAREQAMNELLVRWGEARQAGQMPAAAGSLSAAREIGEALAEIGGDRMVSHAVSEIDQAKAPLITDRLARAFAALGTATRLFRDLSVEAAGSQFAEARGEFSRSGSLMVLWADCGLAGVELSRHHYGPAFKIFAALSKRVDRRLYPALYGRIFWGLGLIRGRQGKLTEALGYYHEAEAAFEKAHEVYNEITMESMSAEGLKLLGEDESAWAYRYRALTALTNLPASRQLHNLLWEAADDLLRSGQIPAAQVFQEEDVEVARQSRDPFMIAESLHRRSRVLAALGRPSEALRDIAEARAVNARGASEITRATTAADIDRAEGEVQLLGDPRAALVVLTRAVESFHEEGRPAEEILSRLTRAQAYLGVGLEAEAETDLAAALASFENEREAIRAPAFRQSFSEAAQNLFDEMILLQAERRRDPRRALEIAEQARTVSDLGDSRPRGASDSEAARSLEPRRIPLDIALVEYALSGDRLLVWTLRHNGIEFMERRIAPEAFATRVADFIAEVRSGSEPVIAAASTGLYSELIPPSIEELPGSVQLVFIPDRLLNGVPFAALRNPRTGRYLVEERALSVAPSAALYLARLSHSSTRDRKHWSALLVSNPTFDRQLFPFVDLPGAAAEVAEEQSLYGDGLVLAGREATRSRLLAELDRHDVFGFAGHAVFNSKAPEDSYLVTTPEPTDRGTILAKEIAALRFHRLRLVVLTACHTSAATGRRIGGLSGLAKPFLEAGASAVLASLWDIDDNAAGRLSAEFHRGFLESGDAAQALRMAQLSALHDVRSSTRSPNHWAGFQLVGGLR